MKEKEKNESRDREQGRDRVTGDKDEIADVD